MLRFAILEDDPKEASALQSALGQFFSERPEEYQADVFPNPLNFLASYNGKYDLLFLDIEMPGMDGMTLAKRIREVDEKTIILFITHLSQMAVEGYLVEALGFIVKPLRYPLFANVMGKALSKMRKNASATFKIHFKNGVRVVDVTDIVYVEVMQHRLLYHLQNELAEAWGSLSEAEEGLPSATFVRCNSCYLINLQHVKGIQNDYVDVGGEKLKISRAKKQEFLRRLIEYSEE